MPGTRINMEQETTQPTLTENKNGLAGAKPAKPKIEFTKYQVFVIVMLALIQFTVVLDFMIISPLGDILKKSLHIDNSQFGVVVAAYAISAALSGILAAGFADKYDRKKLLLFFYVGFVLGTLFCGLSNTYNSLFIARIVTGIFGGVISSIGMAIITDLFTPLERGRVMGFVQMAFAASQVLGVPAGIEIANRLNWNATFIMIVGLALVIGVLFAMRFKPVTGHLKLQKEGNAFQHLWKTIKKRNYRIGFLAISMLSMGGFMIMPFTAAFLINNVKVPKDKLSIIFLCTGLSSIVIMPLVGKLSDKIDRLKLFAVGSVVAMIMIVVYTNLGPTPVWLVTTVNIVLFMGIMSRMVPATAMNTGIPEMADRGAYMSISASLQQMAGGLAAIIGGKLLIQPTEESPYENFYVLGWIMSVLILLCIYLMYRVKQITKPKAAH